MQVLSSLSGITFYAPSAGHAPTNSADVSAIASAYQVVSATATQLYAGTAYVTSINDAPVSAARAGNAANASLANSAYYDGTGRLISALPDSATVSAIASSYVESGVSSKQDTLSFAYNTADQISSINGSALGGMDEAAVSGIASAYAESAVSSKADSSSLSSYALSADVSGTVDLVSTQSANWGGSALALSAGPGVKFDKVGNTLRVSVAHADETVLWDGEGTGSTSATLSESILNFETIKIVYAGAERHGGSLVVEFVPNSNISNYGIELTDWFINSAGSFLVCSMGFYTVSVDGKTLTGAQIKHMWFTIPNMTYSGTGTSGVKLFKIIGCNRIASN